MHRAVSRRDVIFYAYRLNTVPHPGQLTIKMFPCSVVHAMGAMRILRHGIRNALAVGSHFGLPPSQSQPWSHVQNARMLGGFGGNFV